MGWGANSSVVVFWIHEVKCKQSQENKKLCLLSPYKRKSTFNISQISLSTWNIYECLLFRSYSIWSLRLWSNVVCLLSLMCRSDNESPGLLLLLLVLKVPILREVCRLTKQTLCRCVSWWDSSTPSSKRSTFLFPGTHPIWARRAPVVWWQLTIAFPAINQLLKRCFFS